MAVEIKREGWLQFFSQMRSPNLALSRLFTIKPGGLYKGDKVAIDVERFGEDVAIAIKKCTGPNLNDFDIFTTKEFEPPSYGEAFPLDVCELLNRMVGVDPFSAEGITYQAQLMAHMAKGFKLIDDKISRAVELQASQILQTGTLTLTNENGDTVYEIDYSPKATHFPTVGTSWSAGGADPDADLQALAEVIRADGKIDPDLLIMGKTALRNYTRNALVKEQLDNRRINMGAIDPRLLDSGMTFYGPVWVGTYEFQLWAYPDTFKDPQTGNPTKYIEDDKVVMLSTKTRLDFTAAMIPLPLGPDPRVAGLLPGRMSSRADGFDVTPNVYASNNGKQVWGELESRPLLIPVQIDGFGCLDTET